MERKFGRFWDSRNLQVLVWKEIKKFVKISKNWQKLQEIGAFWTVIEVHPCANLRAAARRTETED